MAHFSFNSKFAVQKLVCQGKRVIDKYSDAKRAQVSRERITKTMYTGCFGKF